jgi:hypothetical protein
MKDYVTTHFFNVPAGREDEAVRYVSDRHMERARSLRGFGCAQMFRCAKEQLTPDARQPWTHLMLYEDRLATPEIDLPSKAPLFADMRDAGLIAPDTAERIYSYGMFAPWKYSKNYTPGPLTHMLLLLANLVPGHEAEYHDWYDKVHRIEITETPGYVGMHRGLLDAVQIPPVRHCPGEQLILAGLQTDDLPSALKEFYDRAVGQSPSGVAWGPRCSAASVARTVHVFESVAGPFR